MEDTGQEPSAVRVRVPTMRRRYISKKGGADRRRLRVRHVGTEKMDNSDRTQRVDHSEGQPGTGHEANASRGTLLLPDKLASSNRT